MILKLLKLILEIIRIILGHDDAPPKPGPMTVKLIAEEPETKSDQPDESPSS